MSGLQENFYPFQRHALDKVLFLREVVRVVAILGPRGSGKTTLCRYLSEKLGMRYITLEDPIWRDYALHYSYKLIDSMDRWIIDEVHRAPPLMIAIKRSVDRDPRKGRFIVTGSVNIFTEGVSPDTMTGRVACVELLPLSMPEIQSMAGGRSFLDFALKKGDFPSDLPLKKSSSLKDQIMAGGYPGALEFYDYDLHTDWFKNHLSTVFKQDLPTLSSSYKLVKIEKLLSLLALSTSERINFSHLARELQVGPETVRRWISILEDMYLIRRINPFWVINKIIPFNRSQKVYFLDSGLQFAMMKKPSYLTFFDKKLCVPLIKSFAYAELLKCVNNSTERIRLSYYSGAKRDVDFILEGHDRLVAIEVQVCSEVSDLDFRPLKDVQKVSGELFFCGIIFYDGDRIVKEGDSFYAVPLCLLWSDLESLVSGNNTENIDNGAI